MSAAVDCPTCARSLRIPDDLHGETVRCPTCGHAFAAPPGLAEAARATLTNDIPVVTETLRPLEVGARQIIPRVPELRPTLIGEEHGKPRPPSTPRSQPTRHPSNDRACPACGERATGRARHCVRCGEFLGDPDDVPWPYLDCEPHRAGLVMGLGIGSVVLAAT